MLAELAARPLQVRQRSAILKRFHASISWASIRKNCEGFLNTDGKRYWRRLGRSFFVRQGKPIGIGSKSVCFMLVAHIARRSPSRGPR